MSKVLVKWSSNYADEFDVDGFVLMDESVWNEAKEKIPKYEDEISIGFGTNEEIEYSNGQEFFNDLSAQVLSNLEAGIIEQTIGGSFGHSGFEYIIEDILNSDANDNGEDFLGY